MTSFQNEFMFQVAYEEWVHHRNFSYGFEGNTLGSIAGTYELVYLGVGVDPCDNLGPPGYGCVTNKADQRPGTGHLSHAVGRDDGAGAEEEHSTMSEPFQKEQRYIVLKMTDVQSAIERRTVSPAVLNRICDACAASNEFVRGKHSAFLCG